MIAEKTPVRWSSLLLSGVILIAAQNASSACNIFVSAVDGDDATPDSSVTPFKTIQAAADVALTPGDTVCVEPGVYFENHQDLPSGGTKGVKVRAGGTAGLPITFQADPNSVGTVVIDMKFDMTPAPGSTKLPAEALGFFIEAHDYITISGFEIKNTTVGIFTKASNSPQLNPMDPLGEYDPPEHIIIENNHIHDVRKDARNPNVFDANLGLVRANDCYDCIIRNNRLHGVSQIDSGGTEIFTNQNSAGIHSFGMLRTVIENNEIYDAHSGVRFKSWTNQPLPGDPLFDPAKIPPPVNKVTDFGLKFRRNLVHDTVLGVRITPSGGSGRVISAKGNAHGNPAHYNAEIYENIFYSTKAGAERLGSQYARMEWALQVDLKGTVEQSEGLKFYNNTVITHNGVTIDAVTGIQIYNNFFSLSETTSGISGPQIAIRTTYLPFRAIQLLRSGTDLNLGTPSAPVKVTAIADCDVAIPFSCDCDLGLDPDLTDNGGAFPVSTPPYSPGQTQFFCDDNVQWTAEITLSDFNYYHVGKNFDLNKFSNGGNGVQAAGIETNAKSLDEWKLLTAGGSNFGLADNFPDSSSQADPDPQANILTGVIINPSAEVTIDLSSPTPFLHPAALNTAGRVGGLTGGAEVGIGAFPNGLYDPNSGPFDPATDSGFIGTPRFVNSPGGMSVE